MSDRAGFVECDTCRAKPGTPLLCGSCFQNREVIVLLEAEIEQLRAELRAAMTLIVDRSILEFRWNADEKRLGYWLDGEWIGDRLEDVIKAEAANAAEAANEAEEDVT